MTASVTLNIPGLFGPWQGNKQPGLSFPQTPAINTFLSRGALASNPKNVQTAEYSCAAYSYLADFERLPQQPVLTVEPVHLRADQRHVRVYGSELLAISSQEADAVLQSLNDFMRAEQWRFEYATPERWYLHLPDLNGITFQSILAALGRPLDDYLPQGDRAGEWHRRLNEWQMLLFDHPVNQQRQNTKQLTVNGLWLWGDGAMQVPLATNRETVITDDATLAGYASHNGMTHQSLPDHFDKMQIVANDCFVHLDALSRPLAYQDEEKWLSVLTYIEAHWISPALVALQKKNIKEMTLQTAVNGQQHQFKLRPSSLWHFWRKSVSLQAWIDYE